MGHVPIQVQLLGNQAVPQTIGNANSQTTRGGVAVDSSVKVYLAEYAEGVPEEEGNFSG